MSASGSGLRLMVVAVLASAAIPAVAPAFAVDRPSCRVNNLTSGRFEGHDAQVAIAAARPGDRLRLRGVCVGGLVIDKSIVITGWSRGERATLTGLGSQRVLDIEGTSETPITVVLRGLRVVHGDAPGLESGGGLRIVHGDVRLKSTLVKGNTANRGGGVSVRGDLSVVDSRITASHSSTGGGIYSKGKLQLRGSTSIDRNSAGWAAGVWSQGPITLWGRSTVMANSGSAAAGIAVYGAALVMNERSSVRRNVALNWAGIFGPYHEPIVLNDRASVRHNLAKDESGGIFGMGPVFLNNHARVVANRAKTAGGGIVSYGVVRLNDHARVSRNHARRGAGIEMMDASLILRDSALVSLNAASKVGGGVLAFLSQRPSVTIWQDAAIRNNAPDDLVTRVSVPLRPPQA